MFFKLLRDLARPQVVAVIDILKRSDGLPVGEIADALQMSYMGVKQYCLELEKRGYVDTWRQPRVTGRPELTYRLTPKAQALFPQLSTELTMEVLAAIRQLHGPTSVEKILFQFFLKKSEAYAKRLRGNSLIERVTALAKLREAEGYCAQVEVDAQHGLRLTEYHNPLAEVMREYPSVARMEESMMARLLQAPVKRDLSTVSGLMRISFLVAGATLPPPAPPAAGARLRRASKRKASAAVESPAQAFRTSAGTPPADSENSETIMAVKRVNTDAMTSDDSTAAEAVVSDFAEQAPMGDAEPAADSPLSTAAMGQAPALTELEPAIAIANGATDDTPEATIPDHAEAEVVAAAVAPPQPQPAHTVGGLKTDSPPPSSSSDEWLLFPDPAESPPSRSNGRSVIPSRSGPKSPAPVAEELLLSL
ncbi:MAG: helix-turn-helix transcriptional regulator [Verrucomicrobiales bacterium]